MRKTTIFLLILSLTFSCCSATDVSAKSAILYEPKTETILFSKDIHRTREIASTTKIMTAVVVLENAELDEIVTVPKSCTGIEGTSLYLKEGEKLSVSDLLYGMLLKSGNDAATVLAHYVGDGSVQDFVGMMNEKADSIGLFDTHFKNPSGLPDDGHYSTAYDMARLTAYAMENPSFSEIVATKEKTITGRSLKNHNKLLWLYNGANGVKTGFTKAAGRCLVSSAERDGLELIAVTLSAPNDWNDHEALFDYGFSNYELYSENKFDEVTSLSVVGGKSATVNVSVKEHTYFLAEKNDVFERKVLIPKFIYAPVKAGDEVGKIIYKVNGEKVCSVSIISDDTVDFLEKKNFFEKILDFIMKDD